MQNEWSLKLRNRDGFKIIETLTHKQINNINPSIKFHFSSAWSLGFGSIELNNVTGEQQIVVGTYPLSQSFSKMYSPMADLDFVTMGIITFHELTHMEQHISLDTQKNLLISDLSKHQNDKYYKENWNKFPFEIDAEYTGVITMWSHLKAFSPEHADHLMLERLTHRAEKTKYMINVPEGGLKFREQIEILFENAYNRSLDNKRDLPVQFLRFDDEVSQLLTVDRGILDRRYEPFYRQLMTAETGEELDLKMASLVAYLHPELQSSYPTLKFEELQPETVFGIQMPETQQEIRNRIGIRTESYLLSESVDYVTELIKQDTTELETSFSDSVAYITQLNNEQTEGDIL